ncbi:unnamed protein product, partial [Urochloa humidicola]
EDQEDGPKEEGRRRRPRRRASRELRDDVRAAASSPCVPRQDAAADLAEPEHDGDEAAVVAAEGT